MRDRSTAPPPTVRVMQVRLCNGGLIAVLVRVIDRADPVRTAVPAVIALEPAGGRS